jgi:mannose-1-phosphate guanylyltransferase
LALAREILEEDGEPFFVLNSDITCEYPMADLLAFHKNHGKEGTIMVRKRRALGPGSISSPTLTHCASSLHQVTKVEEPSKYGVVVLKEGGQIDKFVEKPKTYVGNKINAGIYIFNPSILNRIEVLLAFQGRRTPLVCASSS